MTEANRKANWLWIALGGLLVLAAVLATSAGIESALRGEADGDLAWGPALFRLMLGVHGLLLMGIGAGVFRRRGVATVAERSAARTPRWAWWGLGGLIVVSIPLRLWNLGGDLALWDWGAKLGFKAQGNGLWLDEILTMLDYAPLTLGQIVTEFPNQNQHMLYSVCVWVAFQLFGEGEWQLRLPAAVFGVACLPVLFLLGRRLVGVREALLACALMTFSYHHVWFSQNARGYSGLLLFAMLATWLWLEALPRGRWGWWIGYAAAVTAGMMVHLTMAFVVAAHGISWLVLVWRTGSGRRAAAGDAGLGSVWMPLGGMLLAAGVTLQLYALSIPQFLRTGLHEESANAEWTNPLWTLLATIEAMHMGWVSAVAALSGGTVLMAVGLLSVWRRSRTAVIAMVLPGLMLVLMIVLMQHNFWPRFAFFAMGFVLLLAVRGMTAAGEFGFGLVMGRDRAVRVAAMVVTVLWLAGVVLSAFTLPKAILHPKQNYAGAILFFDYRRVEKQANDHVMVVGLAAKAYAYYKPDWPEAVTVADIDAAAARADGDLWVVYTLGYQLESFAPELWSVIERDFRVVERHGGTLGGGEVYVKRYEPADRTD